LTVTFQVYVGQPVVFRRSPRKSSKVAEAIFLQASCNAVLTLKELKLADLTWNPQLNANSTSTKFTV